LRRLRALAIGAGASLLATGCGGSSAIDRVVPGPPVVTRPIGVGPGFRLPPHGPAAAAGAPIGALSCRPGALAGPVVGHLEIFARRDTLIIPAGIGVRRGRCRYPVRTTTPTGVVVAGRPGLTLGDLFSIWGQPLHVGRIAGFTGPTAAFVGGRRVRGDIRRIPIRHHSQIVIEVSGYVPPHAHYVFPPATRG
jgi:hypothetical protein